jgi:hypothetical protein
MKVNRILVGWTLFVLVLVILAYPDRGNAYICGADAGEIGDHFLMNNKGFFLGNSGGGLGGHVLPADEPLDSGRPSGRR